MGEYAKLKGTGEEIKIGTCENMYYLRADQVNQVWAKPGNVDPIKDRNELRFRFPWPNEDNIAPGSFDDPFRSLAIYDVEAPEGLEHYSIQFSSNNVKGYLVSLPCPESDEGKAATAYRVGRNGFAGAVHLVQQRYHEGRLVVILQCACGAKWRVPTMADVVPVLQYLHDEAIRRAYTDGTPNEFYLKIADRIIEGYRDGTELSTDEHMAHNDLASDELDATAGMEVGQ